MARRKALMATAGLAWMAGVTAVQAQDATSHVDDIVVTGSRIAGGDRIAPVETVGREALAAAGVSDTSEILRLVAANSGSEARVDQLNQPQSSGTAQFNLRNLGLGSTLVLVDGQRWTSSAVVATDGSAFVDINSLVPMIALQRVEIVKDGASAVYGSDAVAGVVNFITRHDVARPEISAKYAVADGSEESVIEAIGGFKLLGGDLTLAASHFHRSALGSDERDFTQAERYGRAGWTAVTSYGQPGSYFRPSKNAYAPDPDCGNPAFGKAYKNSASDTFCRLDYSDFFDLIPEETRTQVFADYRRPVGDMNLSLQAAYSSTETEARLTPSLPILAQALTVPGSHPDNPFGEDVLFRGRLLGAEAGAMRSQFEYQTWRLTAGLDGAFANGWTWNVAATASRQHVAYDKPDVIGSALQNALKGLGGAGCNPATGAPGAGGCQYFNPFGSAYLGTGTANSAALIDSLTGNVGLRGASGLITLDAATSGQAFAWNGGSVDVAVGAQYRRSTFRHDWSDLANAGDLLTSGYSPDFSGDQEALAAFAEARIHLGDRIEAQLAGRYESYDGDQGRFSPKAAIRWDATDALALRASWGQGFRAPSVYALSGAQASQPSVFDRGAFVFVNTLTSGDANLKPEKSESLSLGALWRPVQGLELGLDAWRFDYTDLVVKQSAQAVIDQAAADTAAGLTGTDAQKRVTRAPNGALTFVQLYFANASSIETQGVDLSARYGHDLWGGRATASATWTYVDSYDIRLNAGSASVSGVGSTNLNNIGRSLPRNRGEFALGWSNGANAVTALVHYTAGYQNDRSGITDPNIASQTTADLLYTRTIGADLDLALGVVNITNEDPPLAQFALGYDPVAADPRGRVFSLGLTKRF
ncbi:iron complex outermembrane receptor protein [Brevundimonas nasdae]|uniref:TonB-dependent receptor domain-containing protein n=1 Tax=Brevundimonas nasdae TaxID=172043 RepID=UPI001911E8FA|nr:TonB-dependent receptor [Brevundimonas nasdae]MBK6025936.1 TonB-dependent receptor [Brevundimonas nasdae]MDQ0452616.1 iron complex outermembrane receptor protein [Brevundimonas nasdae]